LSCSTGFLRFSRELAGQIPTVQVQGVLHCWRELCRYILYAIKVCSEFCKKILQDLVEKKYLFQTGPEFWICCSGLFVIQREDSAYLSCVIFSGHYVPQLAKIIYEKNKGIQNPILNLKGFVVNIWNPCFDCTSFIWVHVVKSMWWILCMLVSENILFLIMKGGECGYGRLPRLSWHIWVLVEPWSDLW
jgi:hypothetical protein